EERLVLLVAWTFWNGAGGPRLAHVLERFDADPMEALCRLVAASRRDDNSSTTRRSCAMVLGPAKDSLDVLIFVPHIQKSLDSYQRLLGLDKTQELETPLGTSHRLRYGTSVVKLMDPKQVPPAGPIGLDKQLGLRCLSFVIRNLRAVCTALEAHGVELTMPA